jgi:homoserine/homoserine lactone efflux protein
LLGGVLLAGGSQGAYTRSMIDPQLFAAFVVAATILIMMPGPIVTLVVANAVAHGSRNALATVMGASVGNAALIAAGALGLTAVLSLVVPVFEWIRWAGAAYLIWLGLRSWRAVFRAAAPMTLEGSASPRGLFWHGLVVALTNPKTILFYAAFFPQFVSPALPAAPQIAAMSVTMLAIAVLSDSLYALLAGTLRWWLAGRARVRHGITGMLLVGTGLGIALTRRR